MAYSKVMIWNMALAHCSINSIIDDEDELSNEASACRTFYDHCRGLLLEMVRWGFAEQQADLQDIGNPPTEWGFRYKYPDNCARVEKIINPYQRTPQKLEDKIRYKVNNYSDGAGKVILTDQPNARIEFNFDITDETLFTATFAEAFALLLASHIMTPLRVDAATKQVISKEWQTWKNEAVINDRTEEEPDTEPDSSHVQARG